MFCENYEVERTSTLDVQKNDEVNKKKREKGGKGKRIVLLLFLLLLLGSGIIVIRHFTSEAYQVEKNLKLAQEAYEAGDFEASKEYYTTVLEYSPVFYDEAYLGLADIYLKDGQEEESIKILQQGIYYITGGDGTAARLKSKLKELVANTDISEIFYYNEKGQKIKNEFYEGGNLQDTYIYTYDENNEINEELHYVGAEKNLFRKDTYVRDASEGKKQEIYTTMDGNNNVLYSHIVEDGNMLSQTWYNVEDGAVSGRIIYEYDEYGRVILEIGYGAQDNSIKSERRMEYDELGNLISEVNISEGITIIDKYAHIYDEQGGLLETTSMDAEGNACQRDTFDANGKITETIYYDENGEVTSTYLYTYDEEGEILTEVKKNASEDYEVRTEYLVIREGNKEIREENTYRAEKRIYQSQKITQYDEQGRKISFERLNNGERIDYTEYDEKGNEVYRCECRGNNGEIETKCYYIYLTE